LPPPRKADIHTHLLPREIPDWKARFGYGGFVRLDHRKDGTAAMRKDDGAPFREVTRELWDADARLSACDDAGVSLQVLSTVPVMFSYWAKPKDGARVSAWLNDHLAGFVSGRAARFAGLGTIPMQDPKLAVKELERCVTQLGLPGVQIGSNVNGKNLGDPEFRRVFEAAESLGAAVFVHPWDMMGQAQMSKYWLPWLVGMPAELSRAICSMIFGGVLERHPRLRVAFAHGGGSFGFTLGRVQHGFIARPDLCAVDNKRAPREYAGKFYVDSLVHDPAALRFLIDLLGDDKIALGTDYPFPLGEEHPGRLIASLKISPAAKKRMLFDNAMDWLGQAARS
jgi:aminocarboxymuconate-semialdehyde decarboxylase